MVKPFSPRELVARVKVILRRLTSIETTEQPPLRHQALTLDPQTCTVMWKETRLTLTATEFNLLQTFMRQPNKVYTRDELSQADIFRDIVTDRTIDSHIRRLRQKLSAAGCPNGIETVHGFGYKIGSCY